MPPAAGAGARLDRLNVTDPVVYRRRVRYSDADAQGIVFNPNYLVYLDDCLTDLMEAAGLGFEQLPARGYEIVLRHMEVDFLRPARINDDLCVGIRFVAAGTTSLTAHGRIWLEHTDETVVTTVGSHVIVDAETFRPTPVPAFVRAALEAVQGPITP